MYKGKLSLVLGFSIAFWVVVAVVTTGSSFRSFIIFKSSSLTKLTRVPGSWLAEISLIALPDIFKSSNVPGKVGSSVNKLFEIFKEF